MRRFVWVNHKCSECEKTIPVEVALPERPEIGFHGDPISGPMGGYIDIEKCPVCGWKINENDLIQEAIKCAE